jgi:integrase
VEEPAGSHGCRLRSGRPWGPGSCTLEFPQFAVFVNGNCSAAYIFVSPARAISVGDEFAREFPGWLNGKSLIAHSETAGVAAPAVSDLTGERTQPVKLRSTISRRRKRRPTFPLWRLRDLHLETFRLLVRGHLRSEATLGQHVQCWGYVIRHFGARFNVRRLTYARAKRFIKVGLETCDPKTVKMRFGTLRAGLRIAEMEGRLTVPRLPTVPFRYRADLRFIETFRDYQRIFDELPLHRAEYFALGIWTGQHASDIERMRWTDLDPFANPPWVVMRNTKNRQDPIRVPCPAELARVFREKYLREKPSSSARLVLPWPSRGNTLPRVCRRLGLVPLSLLSCRHTFASWLVRRKGITPAAQRLMGHRSTAMLSRVYAHAMPLQFAEAIDELDSIRSERPRRFTVPPMKAGAR